MTPAIVFIVLQVSLLSRTFSKWFTLHFSHIGLLHIYAAARFISRDISVVSPLEHYSFASQTFPCNTEASQEAVNLMFVPFLPRETTANHFMPLVDIDLPLEFANGRCGADIFCSHKSKPSAEHISCKFCMLPYHKGCLQRFSENFDDDVDDCGCGEVFYGRNR